MKFYKEITILDILSKSQVTAKYNPDAESKLLELRRMLLKLTGVVVYGHSEKPKKVLSATITSMSTMTTILNLFSLKEAN